MLEVTIGMSNEKEFKTLSKGIYFALLDSLEASIVTGDSERLNKTIARALDIQKMSSVKRVLFKTFITTGKGWLAAQSSESKKHIGLLVTELKRSFNTEQVIHNFDYGIMVKPNFNLAYR